MKYKLLTNADPLELGRLVSNHLKKGWALYGLPLMVMGEDWCDGSKKAMYGQAIIASWGGE